MRRWNGRTVATNMPGGQQQRVAAARELAMNPDLVLADEPTGARRCDRIIEVVDGRIQPQRPPPPC